MQVLVKEAEVEVGLGLVEEEATTKDLLLLVEEDILEQQDAATPTR